jgi:hypothetical protein
MVMSLDTRCKAGEKTAEGHKGKSEDDRVYLDHGDGYMACPFTKTHSFLETGSHYIARLTSNS